jgi:hypothetical protein
MKKKFKQCTHAKLNSGPQILNLLWLKIHKSFKTGMPNCFMYNCGQSTKEYIEILIFRKI